MCVVSSTTKSSASPLPLQTPATAIGLAPSEFRSYGDDPALREDATGTYWGRPGEVRGGRLWLPPAGEEGRVTRLAVMARRNDPEMMGNDTVGDALSITAHVRPRWINIPRQP